MNRIVLGVCFFFFPFWTFGQIEISSINYESESGACDGAICVYANGSAGPFTFLWSTGETTECITNLCAGPYSVTVTNAYGCETILSTTLGVGLDVTETITHETCSGGGDGIIAVDIAGYSFPYNEFYFTWYNESGQEEMSGYGLPAIDDLTAGVYTCEITDGFAILYCGEFIIDPSSDTPIEFELLDVICICAPEGFGGLEVAVSGGTPPYEFAWTGPGGYSSTEQSPLDMSVEGGYQLVVGDANGCTAGEGFPVNFCSQPLFNEAVFQSCAGPGTGSIAINMIQPTLPPYSFAWTKDGMPYSADNSNPTTGESEISNLYKGEYCLTIFTNNGCSAYKCWGIESSNPPQYYYTVSPEVNGDDGAIDLTVYGGGPFAFNWSNNEATEDVSGLSAGEYNVAISYDEDQACILGLEFNVYNCNDLASNISLNTTSTPSYGGLPQGSIDLTVEGGEGYSFNYQWSNGSNEEDIQGLVGGNYCVTVTHSSCPSFSMSTCVDVCSFGLEIVPFEDPPIYGCDGINMLAQVSGGAPLSYSWSNGGNIPSITFDYNQEYCVTVVDDGGCEGVQCLIVPSPELKVIEVISDASSGGGNGSIDLTVVGGWPPYSFLWDTGETTEDLTNLEPGQYCVTVSDQCGDYEECYTVNCEIQSLDVSATIVDVGCSEGSLGAISLDLSQVPVSNPSFQFLWSSGETTQNISNLTADQYCVGILETTTQCLFNACFDVLADDEEPFSISFDNSFGCVGGEVGTSTVIATGGNEPYTYEWSTGETSQSISGLPGGWVNVTVYDAVGCSVSDHTFIWAEPTVSLSGVVDGSPVCEDQNASIQVTATGGTPPYTYQWQDCFPCTPIPGETNSTISGLGAGEYIVLVTDANGCTKEGYYEILDSELEFAVSIVEPNCGAPNGGSIELDVTGMFPPFTYVWSNGSVENALTGLAEGTYSVTIADAKGCSIEDEFTLDFNLSGETFTVFADELISPSYEGAEDGEISIDVSIPGNFTYNWSNGASGSTIVNLPEGSYSVTVTSDNGCQSFETFELLPCKIWKEEVSNTGEIIEVLVPNPDIPEFDFTVNVPISNQGDAILNLSVLLQEENGPFSENIPGQYSIEWLEGFGTQFSNPLGFGQSLVIDLSDYPYSNFSVIVSNGCEELKKTFPIIGCENYDEYVVRNYFMSVEDFIKPCEGGGDGVLIFDFDHPDSDEVEIQIDGNLVPIPQANETGNIYIEVGGLYSGEYVIEITIGDCSFSFQVSLGTAASHFVFNEYIDTDFKDDIPGECNYNKWCEGMLLDEDFNKEPNPHWDGSTGGLTESCKTPLICPGNGEAVVGFLNFNKKWSTALEYYQTLEMAAAQGVLPYSGDCDNPYYLDNLYCYATLQDFKDCYRVRFCEGNLRFCAVSSFVIYNGVPLPTGNIYDSYIDENGCKVIFCPAYPLPVKICLEDLVNSQYDYQDVEYNNCIPTSFNIASACEWRDYLEANFPEYENNSELKIFLDNICEQDVSEYKCATVWFCQNDFTKINDNLGSYPCGELVDQNCLPDYIDGPFYTCDELPPDPENPDNYTPGVYFCQAYGETCVIEFTCNSPTISEPNPPIIFCPNLQPGNTETNYVQVFRQDHPVAEGLRFGIKKSQEAVSPFGIATLADSSILYSLIPNEKGPLLQYIEGIDFIVEDWDNEFVLYSETENVKEVRVLFEQESNTWINDLFATNTVILHHLSANKSGIYLAGTFQGELSYNDYYIGSSFNPALFFIHLDYQGNMVKLDKISGLSNMENVSFSNTKDGSLIVGGEFMGTPLYNENETTNQSSSSGLYFFQFDFSQPPVLLKHFVGTSYELQGITYSGDETGIVSFLVLGKGELTDYGIELLNPEDLSIGWVNFEVSGQVIHSSFTPLTGYYAESLSITSDHDGTIVLGLSFQGQVKFAGHSFQSTGNEADILILVMNSEGEVLESKVIGSSAPEYLSDLMLDNKTIYFGGLFAGVNGSRPLGTCMFIDYSHATGLKPFISTVGYTPAEKIIFRNLSDKSDNIPDNSLRAFPNPFSNSITIEVYNPAVTKVQIHNLLGQMLESVDLRGKQSVSIPMEEHSTGVYIISGYDSQGVLISQTKVVKGL